MIFSSACFRVFPRVSVGIYHQITTGGCGVFRWVGKRDLGFPASPRPSGSTSRRSARPCARSRPVAVERAAVLDLDDVPKASPASRPWRSEKSKAASPSGSPSRSGLSPPVARLGYILRPASSSASLIMPSIVRVAALIASSTTASGVAAVMYFKLFSSNASTR